MRPQEAAKRREIFVTSHCLDRVNINYSFAQYEFVIDQIEQGTEIDSEEVKTLCGRVRRYSALQNRSKERGSRRKAKKRSNPKHRRELWSSQEEDYPVQQRRDSIYILDPERKGIYVLSKRAQIELIENSETVRHYKLYTAVTYLRLSTKQRTVFY